MSDSENAARRDGRTTDTAKRVREVALELFVQQGFSRTTLQDIADRLGLTKAALYYHFPTKAALIKSVVQPAIDEVDAFLSETQRAPLPPCTFLERFFDLTYRHRLVFIALTSDPTGLGSADAERWVPRLAQQAQELLAGPNATPADRIRAVTAISGLSRCATLLVDIPHDELRATSVEVACQTLGLATADPTA